MHEIQLPLVEFRANVAKTYLSQLVNAMVKMLDQRDGCLLIGFSIIILGMYGSVKGINAMKLMINLLEIKPQLHSDVTCL